MQLTKSNFVAWLKDQSKDTIVGTRGVNTCCPLATYLREMTGEPYNVDQGFYKDKYAKHLMPTWASIFVDQIDYDNDNNGPPVTAGEALDVLSQIIAEDVG